MKSLIMVDESQRSAARFAGFLYLFTMAGANFVEFYMRGRVIVPATPRRQPEISPRPGSSFAS